jgi:ATP-dependent exoDNAse (exonuclease V) beta subunit
VHVSLDLQGGRVTVTEPAPSLRLTDEQAIAVERRDGPLFLSAGAGSGKTRVLVERFVRAVCDDDVGVERILAITFTEKAAAELKARLRERFMELGEREHARAAEGAWIGTIHGFCARLLRAHALAAGLDPEYQVLDASDAERVAIAAFDSALGDFMRDATDVERLDLVASYTPDKLRAMVRAVHAQRRSQGYREPALPEPPEPPPMAGEREELERAVAAAQRELGLEEPKPRVTAALEKLSGCASALELLLPDAIAEPGEYVRFEIKPGNTKALAGPEVTAFIEAHARFVAICSAHRAAAQYRHVRRLLEHYSTRYEDAKRERSVLDFEDLELLARDLLKDRPDICRVWQERFQHVMVDEYQDTNALQDELLDLLAAGRLFAVGDDRQSIYGFRYADVEGFRDRREEAAAGGNAARLDMNFRSSPDVLSVVNHVFAGEWGEEYTPLAPGLPARAARVELLISDRKKDRWESLGDDPFGPTMHTSTLWRAAEARLLAKRIEEIVAAEADIGYGDVAVLMRAATDMPLYERSLNERGIPTYAAGSRGYFSQQQIADLRAYLAALANPLDGVALYSLLASPIVGVSLDALALIRLHSRAEQRDPWWWLERTFGDAAGAPNAVDGPSAAPRAPAVASSTGAGSPAASSSGPTGDALAHEAPTADEPARDADEEESYLAWLAENVPDDDPWADPTEAAASDPAPPPSTGAAPSPAGAFSESDGRKLAEFVPRFAAERRTAPRLSLETVIDRAQTASGYDRVVLGMPNGERRLANVRKLMRLAREFEARGGRDLRRFIDFVDEQELIAAREGEAPLETESLSAVRLMTIHAAKGLEFPVVAVADMGRDSRSDDTPLRVSPDGRIGLELASLAGRGAAALDLDELKREEEARAEAEERRIFYVAMTRAERHLILSGATDAEKWPPDKPLGAPIDWVWRAIDPDLGSLLETTHEVEVSAGGATVKATMLSPATVDTVLSPADRIPAGGTAGAAAQQIAVRAPEFAPVQAPVSLPLARLSYSSLEGYARCGYRFYLERVARLRESKRRSVDEIADMAIAELVPSAGEDEVGAEPIPRVDLFFEAAATAAGDEAQLGLPLAAAAEPAPLPEGRLGALVRGSIVHALLERIDFARPTPPSEDDVAATIASYGENVDPEDVVDVRGLVQAFLDSPLCERVRAARRARKELVFAFPLGRDGESILVNGVIDVHADEDRGALVLDYKSDRLEGADPVAYCDEHYSTQRLVYALAALRAEAERVEVIHLFLERTDAPVSVIYTRDDIAGLEDQLRSLAAGVVAGRFEPAAEPHIDLCRGCPGRAALCSWDESMTGRALPVGRSVRPQT